MHHFVRAGTLRASFITALLASSAAIAPAALAQATYVNSIAIPGNTTVFTPEAGVPAINNRLGMFSDIYYDPNHNEYWGLADRGPGGGVLSYNTRVERFTLTVNPLTGVISNFQTAQTVMFTDPKNLLNQGAGANLNGLAPNAPPNSVIGRAFDPEGLVVVPNSAGNFLVSSEYGPSIYEFNRQGELQRVLNTPANLVPRDAANTPNLASDAGNTQGIRINRGFEGLAVSPDGQYAYAVLQAPLVDEGGNAAGVTGHFVRIVKFDLASGDAVAQYAYQFSANNQGRGLSALVAINDHEFMVIERNNRGIGVPDANTASPDKNVFIIDITGATDVTNIALPATGTIAVGFTPVSKTAQYIDLDANLPPGFNIAPEKWEGLSIGPQLNDGRYLILAGTDNDFSVTQNGTGTQFDVYYNPTGNLRIQCDLGESLGDTVNNPCNVISSGGTVGAVYAGSRDGFNLIPGVLAAFAAPLPNYDAPIPEPATLGLFGLGLAGLGFARRRR